MPWEEDGFLTQHGVIMIDVPFLNLNAQHEAIGPKLNEAFQRVLDTGWYINGKEVDQFEKDLDSYLGCDFFNWSWQ